MHQVPTLLLLTLFQLLTALQLILGGCDPALELTAFGGLIGLEWALYLALRAFRRTGFEAETLAFFLCTMGLAVVSSSAPESLIKELLAIVAGVCVFLVVCWSLRDLERAKTVRYLAAVAGIGLLAFNLLFGVENSARATGSSWAACRSSRRSSSRSALSMSARPRSRG